MSVSYLVTLEVEGGRRLTYRVKATGLPAAAQRAREQLARALPTAAYTAIVVEAKPEPEPDPG